MTENGRPLIGAVAVESPAQPTNVRIDDVLELCRSLARDSAVDPASLEPKPPQVIPVLLDDLARWRGLLAEVLTSIGGVVIDADNWGLGAPVADSLPSLLEEATRTLADLEKHDPESYSGLHIETTDEMTLVDGDTPLASASHAQQTVRSVIAAMFHIDLRTASISALCWDDSPLDAASSHLIFSLAQRLPELLALGPNTTLVVVVGNGALRVNDHCVGRRGARYRITGRDLIQRRAPYEANVDRVRELARLTPTDAPLAVLLLGAGVSVSAGLPTGNQLRNKALAARLEYQVDDSNSWNAGYELFGRLEVGDRLTADERREGPQAFASQLTLERVLREEQYQEGQRYCQTLRLFSELHAQVVAEIEHIFPPDEDPLRELLASGRQLVLVTVNFDSVVEARGGDYVHAFTTEADFEQFPAYLDDYRRKGGPIPLLKLHGDIASPETLVANVEEDAAGLSRLRLGALLHLRESLGPVRPWWYVGYSMRDPDLNRTFSEPVFASDLVEHWVSPLPIDSVTAFVGRFRQRVWAQAGHDYAIDNRLVTLTGEEFWRLLRELRAT